MFPKSRKSEKAHRQRKRSEEVSLIIDCMRPRIRSDQQLAILEFGSGDGFQIPYLQQPGRLVASDIYLSDDIRQMPGVEFVQCGIGATPFGDAQFDVIFSNHVIEHVDDLSGAFLEMQRIGKPDCLYAFSVPTHIWLLLSVPGQYYSRARELGQWLRRRSHPKARAPASRPGSATAKRAKERRPLAQRLMRQLVPSGHGVERRFTRCYRMFRIETWQRLFAANGFSLLETRPLLLYGPSKWPLVPTMRSRGNLCSSVLFLMRKSAATAEPSRASH